MPDAKRRRIGDVSKSFDEPLPTGGRAIQHFFAVGFDMQREAKREKSLPQRHAEPRERWIAELKVALTVHRLPDFIDSHHGCYSRSGDKSELILQCELNDARIG